MGGDCELILSLDVGGSIIFGIFFLSFLFPFCALVFLITVSNVGFCVFFFLHKLLFSQALLQSVCLATFSLDSFARSPEMNEWMNDIYFDEKYVMKTGILAKKRLLSKTYHMRSSRRVRSDEQPPSPVRT